MTKPLLYHIGVSGGKDSGALLIAEECGKRNREFVKAMLDIDLVEVIRADWPEFVEKIEK